MDLILPTICFIVYTPNVIFKPFIKNKWYNLTICSLLFVVTLYILEKLIIFREGLTTAPSGVDKHKSKDCIASGQYADTVFQEIEKLSNQKPKMPSPPSTLSKDDKEKIKDYAVINHQKNLEQALNNITNNNRAISRNLCNDEKLTWTPPPAEYYKDPVNYSKNLGIKAMESITIAPEILALYSKTPEPTTMKPTTMNPTTMKPTTMKPTTMNPTTMKPTTMNPTTMKPTTMNPTTMKPTSMNPATMKPTVATTTIKPTVATTTKPTVATTTKPTVATTTKPIVATTQKK